jgi:hypothetical protein
MNRKEWREVGRQSLYFILALAAMALLLMGMDLLMGMMGFAQAKPLEGEKLIIILGAWLLMFSMFLGLSPFAMDSKQKGMEYLFTLPYSRRRLLLIKLLPRLAATVIFYLMFVLLYGLIGNAALGGGYTLFSLAYFALFFISFSLALVHENFIVQFIWAGIALSGYLALCLYVVGLGFSWKFRMPGSWVVSRSWQDLAYDVPTLLAVIAVFLLLAAPFIVSFFIAFKKFDLKPARVFNRRQLLIFVPLLLLAFFASLGLTYFVQTSSSFWESDLFILKNYKLLKSNFPGKLTLYEEAGRRSVDIKGRILWGRLLLEQGEQLYLNGLDLKDGSRIIGCLNQNDLSWRILHRISKSSHIANGHLGIRYDGAQFVYLLNQPDQSARPENDGKSAAEPMAMQLVRVDPASGRNEIFGFQVPAGGRNNEPWLVGSDERNGRRFWLVALRGHNVLRLWDDGRIEELGLSGGIPVYAGGLLFTHRGGSMIVSRLLDAGSERIHEMVGGCTMGNPYFFSQGNSQMTEIYALRDERIVRIDLATMSVDDIGPGRGHLHMVPPGDFYFVEFESWPPKKSDKWKKLYRLKDGRLSLLKKFDFDEGGYGHLLVNANGIKLIHSQWKDGKAAKATMRLYAFPDLRELRFKGLD